MLNIGAKVNKNSTQPFCINHLSAVFAYFEKVPNIIGEAYVINFGRWYDCKSTKFTGRIV